ncbi:MAG TPA: YpdA family putative bacillithiol disulfide reductase [Gemmatimonadaceae bacterium]|jgi:thioredoxin reductase (NADPH)|nr:YpdA family putative bacillithiol disulfide reductase [Gemmatimonadaceae bacterium]
MPNDADVVIVGGGPCGLAAAVSAQRVGLRPLVIESGVAVSSIAAYPTYARFFSTAEKLSIGGLPFVIATEKPTRRDALAYYRAVVSYFAIPLRQRERVTAIQGWSGEFTVVSRTAGGEESRTRAGAVVVATGYFGSPNRIGVPGEDLPHVTHVYREGHEAFLQDAVVVGGGNSAAEAALDLWRSGARVTLVHFGPTFDKKIKPWVLPDFTNRVKEGLIAVRWDSRVKTILPQDVVLTTGKHEERLKADRVYIMTGFAPSVDLLRETGVAIDPKTGIPAHDPHTLETPTPGLFVAGVVVAGYDANKVFIENGRFHGDRIVARLMGQRAPAEPKLSAELDT